MSMPQHPSLTNSPLPPWRQRLQPLEQRLAPLAPAGAFVGGFVYDTLTLDRIDKLGDNLQIMAYLLGLAWLLVMRKRVGMRPSDYRVLREFYPWMHYGVQFFFGGLFSAYVVFTFKSASFTRSLVFLGLLAALMVGNELLSHRLRMERAHVGLYGLCSFAFLLFLVPVVTGHLGPWVFPAAVAGGLLSALALGRAMDREPDHVPGWRHTLARHIPPAASLLTGMTALYLLGAIPPVPLAIMEGGIFHDVQWVDEGVQVKWQRPPMRVWPRDDSTFAAAKGDKAWCFTAVFSPNNTELQIQHRWEWYSPEHERWMQSDLIPFKVKGGRDGGYRGYTRKRNLKPGDWRVTVETERERVLGRYEFEVTPAAADPVWKTRIIE